MPCCNTQGCHKGQCRAPGTSHPVKCTRAQHAEAGVAAGATNEDAAGSLDGGSASGSTRPAYLMLQDEESTGGAGTDEEYLLH